MTQIVTGDDVRLIVTLKKDGAVFPITTTPVPAVVKARIVGPNHQIALSSEVTQSHLTSGADWANSLIVVLMDGATTAAITQQGSALLEIQVDDGIKITWFVPVTIIKGFID